MAASLSPKNSFSMKISHGFVKFKSFLLSIMQTKPYLKCLDSSLQDTAHSKIMLDKWNHPLFRTFSWPVGERLNLWKISCKSIPLSWKRGVKWRSVCQGWVIISTGCMVMTLITKFSSLPPSLPYTKRRNCYLMRVLIKPPFNSTVFML